VDLGWARHTFWCIWNWKRNKKLSCWCGSRSYCMDKTA